MRFDLQDYLTYLDIAQSYTQFSKCQFTQVACIFVNENGRVVSTGVNGSISSAPNCGEFHFEQRDDHVSFTEMNEIHAEMNAILELARSSTAPKELTVFVTLSPCFNCLKHLLGLKSKGLAIKEIVYDAVYHRLTPNDLSRMHEMCARVGVDLYNREDIEAMISEKEESEDYEPITFNKTVWEVPQSNTPTQRQPSQSSDPCCVPSDGNEPNLTHV